MYRALLEWSAGRKASTSSMAVSGLRCQGVIWYRITDWRAWGGYSAELCRNSAMTFRSCFVFSMCCSGVSTCRLWIQCSPPAANGVTWSTWHRTAAANLNNSANTAGAQQPHSAARFLARRLDAFAAFIPTRFRRASLSRSLFAAWYAARYAARLGSWRLARSQRLQCPLLNFSVFGPCGHFLGLPVSLNAFCITPKLREK